MLEDLSEVLVETRARAESLKVDEVFEPSSEIWDEVLSAYKRATPSDKTRIVSNALVVQTPTGGFLTISGQEIPRCWSVAPYANALAEYERLIDKLAKALNYVSRNTGGAGEVFKSLNNPSWKSAVEPTIVSKIEDAISNSLGLSPEDQVKFRRFLADKTWSGVAKTLERGDWRDAAIVAAGRWLANASDRRGSLSAELAKSKHFEALMQNAVEMQKAVATEPVKSSKSTTAGINRILYGAPGTGKSYAVTVMVGRANVIRTVFHPDTQNSDFFGSLKPVMVAGKVAYQFAPGPLCRALCAAMKDPEHHHYLVIEELNRAPAAAVFGELFQLLDRDENGHGEYEVDFPNPESAEWFNVQGVVAEKLLMPSNLSIIATMNSADQGVYPLDTAFRRRWEQEYLPLYEGKGPQGDVGVTGLKDAEIRVSWKVFVKALNEWLLKLDLAEDRLLGLWFAKERELGQHVPAKILLYLWDDLLRHEGRTHLFAQHIRTYGELNQAVKARRQIFSNGFVEALEMLQAPAAALDNVSAPEGIDAAGE